MFVLLFIMNVVSAAVNLSADTFFGLIVGVANIISAGLMLHCMVEAD